MFSIYKTCVGNVLIYYIHCIEIIQLISIAWTVYWVRSVWTRRKLVARGRTPNRVMPGALAHHFLEITSYWNMYSNARLGFCVTGKDNPFDISGRVWISLPRVKGGRVLSESQSCHEREGGPGAAVGVCLPFLVFRPVVSFFIFLFSLIWFT
jgi:hypothetical protein